MKNTNQVTLDLEREVEEALKQMEINLKAIEHKRYMNAVLRKALEKMVTGQWSLRQHILFTQELDKAGL